MWLDHDSIVSHWVGDANGTTPTPRWLEADKQERRFAELLSQGGVTTVLLHAMAV